MLIVRVQLPGEAEARHGRVLETNPLWLEICEGDPFAATLAPTGERVLFEPEAWQALHPAHPRLLAPVVPGKIIGVGSNYHDHIVEMGKPIPKEPILFMKPPSAVLDPGRPILRPPGYDRVDYEGELAVVVGRRMHRVTEAEVPAFLLGYTALNDVSVRDLQKRDGQFTRAKGFDTFCPLGPAISTDLSGVLAGSFSLITRKNGQVVQDSGKDRFLFPITRLVSFISHVMTLNPGDVITTGTPSGVGNMSPGDVVEIQVSGLPPMRNPVESGPPPYGAT